jgi:hypothetical protein
VVGLGVRGNCIVSFAFSRQCDVDHPMHIQRDKQMVA